MLIHTLTDVEVLIRVWSPFSETSAHIDLTEPGDAYVFILMAITNKARAPGLRSSHLPSQLRKSFWQDDAQRDQPRPRSFMNKLEMKV